MKLVQGKTFQEAIAYYHTLPDKSETKTAAFRDLIRRLASVCQTVSFAHERGIIHCDLKPANIMLGEFGETLVMDWGLARPFVKGGDTTLGDLAAEKMHNQPENWSGAAETHRIIGTPSHMSPEQASGKFAVISPQSDIYSLGVILYQILTEQLPHAGDSTLEVLEKIQKEHPRKPSEIDKSVSKDLEAICLTAMDHEQSRRYPTVRAMFRDLTNWLDDESVSVRKETRWEKAWRWVRKNKTLAVTLLTSAFVFLIVLGISGIMLERARVKIVAAVMLADRMEQLAREALEIAAEEALKLVGEEEDRLKTKERELETLWKQCENLNGDTEEERSALQNQVSALTHEVNSLRIEIEQFRRLADSIFNSLSIKERSVIIEFETAQKLVEKFAKAKK